ncbi:MAG: hypothetical protein ACRDZN_07495 [Acidimicrobiales bacterium]
MALSTKHRSSIYRSLSPVLGEEEAEALLSQFPARDLDEPVTKEFVRAEIADVRAESAKVRAEIAALEARITERLREQTIWVTGAMTVGLGIAAGIGSLAG